MENDHLTRNVIGSIIAVCVIIGSIIFIATGYEHIDPGYAGILIDYAAGSNGKPVIVPKSAGQYVWIGPFSGQKLVSYPVAQQSLVLSSNTAEGEIPGDSTIACQMSGGGIVHIGLSVLWQVNAQHPEILYQKKPNTDLTSTLNDDVNTTIVYGAVRGDLLDLCSRYSWQDVLGDGTGPSKTDVFKSQLLAALQADLTPDGIIVNQIFLNERRPDATIQQVLDAHNEAQKSAFLKEQAENEASAAIAKAQGEAQAIEIINAQLAKSPTYIQYLIAQKWDGKLPSMLSTDGKTNTVLSPFGGN